MNNLSIFHPHIMQPVFGDALDTLFTRFMEPVRIALGNGALDIRVDVSEVDGHYKVHADLPGVKKEDIHVRVDGNTIQIDAQVKNAHDLTDSAGKVLRSERYHGVMSRTFSVAENVDESLATAKFDDGVLTMDLPKKASDPSRKRLAIQ